MISDEEIRETFYNIFLDIMMSCNLNELQDKLSNFRSRANLIRQLTVKTLYRLHGSLTADKSIATFRRNLVNRYNVPFKFSFVFNIIENKELFKNIYQIEKLADEINEIELFQNIINDVIIFYLDSQRTMNCDVNEHIIIETFYNIMIYQLLEPESKITKEDIENQEPYIYFALAAGTIIGILESSKECSGMRILNNAIVTNDNCPAMYIPLFSNIKELKEQYDTFNDETSKIIKIICSNDSNKLSKEIEDKKTPVIMQFISKVNNIAIEITRLTRFKNIIDSVLTFSLNMLTT